MRVQDWNFAVRRDPAEGDVELPPVALRDVHSGPEDKIDHPRVRLSVAGDIARTSQESARTMHASHTDNTRPRPQNTARDKQAAPLCPGSSEDYGDDDDWNPYVLQQPVVDAQSHDLPLQDGLRGTAHLVGAIRNTLHNPKAAEPPASIDKKRLIPPDIDCPESDSRFDKRISRISEDKSNGGDDLWREISIDVSRPASNSTSLFASAISPGHSNQGPLLAHTASLQQLLPLAPNNGPSSQSAGFGAVPSSAEIQSILNKISKPSDSAQVPFPGQPAAEAPSGSLLQYLSSLSGTCPPTTMGPATTNLPFGTALGGVPSVEDIQSILKRVSGVPEAAQVPPVHHTVAGARVDPLFDEPEPPLAYRPDPSGLMLASLPAVLLGGATPLTTAGVYPELQPAGPDQNTGFQVRQAGSALSKRQQDIKPPQITEWHHGLRCVVHLGNILPQQSEDLRRMIAEQNSLERKWSQQYEKLKGELKQKVEIIGSCDTSARLASSPRPGAPDLSLRAELSRYAEEIHKHWHKIRASQVERLRKLEIPFFCTLPRLIIDGDHVSAEADARYDPSFDGPKITKLQLHALQKKMLETLEAMYKDV